ncbi:MAG: RNA-binding protein [Methermicoccaceae archaeon]
MRIKKRQLLRKKQKKHIIPELESYLAGEVSFESAKIELLEVDGTAFDIVLVDGEPLAFLEGERVVPSLRAALKYGVSRGEVVVDAGAVKHVVNGADIMAPGVVSADASIESGDTVFVKEEAHGKFLSVGEALMAGSLMKGEKGKVVKSIHHVGDELWKLEL